MTHAELLRSHADLATKEGGVYYSGEYLSRIAATAESLEHEYTRLLDDNARLQEVVTDGELHAREILGENAKLRERVAELEELEDGKRYIRQEWYQLVMTENEKLRELCADMWRFTGAACKKYPRLFDPAAQGPQMVQLNMLDAFEQRMYNLGIEVG